jgi:hypothetical protein
MADSRKSKARTTGSRNNDTEVYAASTVGSDEESVIRVIPKKNRLNGSIKLKKPAPKQNEPGNWMDARVIDGRFCLLAGDSLNTEKTRTDSA